MPTAGAGVSVESEGRVKVTENMADTAVPTVVTSALFALDRGWTVLIRWAFLWYAMAERGDTMLASW